VTGVTLLPVMVISISMHRQTETVLLVGGSEDLVVPARLRLRDRLAVRWRARRLDRALAAGTSPEASATLALRAQQLTEPERRRSIAGGLRRIVHDAHEGCRRSSGRVMPDPAGVKAASEQLSLLADRLDEPGPVAAGGVAGAWLLLTDGTGPLYNPRRRASLGERIARATRELRPSVTL
jgi:hypothetical protein